MLQSVSVYRRYTNMLELAWKIGPFLSVHNTVHYAGYVTCSVAAGLKIENMIAEAACYNHHSGC